MLAGPSLSNCFNSEGGMGMCLRGKMVDAGILPQPAVAIAEPQAKPAEPAVAAVEPEVAPPEVAAAAPEVAAAEPDVAIATPGLDVTPPAVTSAPNDLIAATFGLLRAQPDGSVVIAGSGTPGSEVEVYSNDQLLGKAKVEASGDWVLVPDAPIPPGGTELTLAEAGKPGRAAESFVVVVNDDKKSEPLVVASTPGAASDILQGLKRPAAGMTTDVATAEATPPVPAPEAPAITEPAAAATPDATAPTADAAVAPAAPAAEPPVADVAVAKPTVEAPAAELPTADQAPVAEAPATVDTPETAVAVADPVVPPAPQPEVALANVPPTIDAIEIEGEKSFFAGGGPEGTVMRLYVDGKYIADATVADGRWLVETGKVLTKPNQRIRIDMLKSGTADVAARAEVDFQVELPSDQPTAVAEATPATPAETTAPVVAGEPVPPAVAGVPVETAPVADVAEAVAAAAPSVAGDKAEPGAVVADTVAPPAAPGDKSTQTENRAVPDQTVAATKPAEQPAATIDNAAKPEAAATAEVAAPEVAAKSQADATAPIDTAKAQTTEVTPPTEPEVAVLAPAVPAVEPTAPAVVSPPAEIPAEPEVALAETTPDEPAAADDVPTMVAVAVGDPELARFASGKAIIRRGDNLWTIARRVYGAGIKYTTIYEANNGQIRNPNQIYPGQVFDLPDNAN